MPWKLLLFLLMIGLVVAFAAVNLQHSADISFGFVTIERVPVFVSVLSAFILGALFSVPFAVVKASKKPTKMPKVEVETSKKRSKAKEPLDTRNTGEMV